MTSKPISQNFSRSRYYIAGEYNIQLHPDANSHAIFTPRHVLLPLRSKVAELDRMEKAGMISKVTKPTEWCARMVVVPKKSVKVRICVDLKPLNQSVLREVHPLPKVDETLVQLAGTKVFLKLDANSGFWQILLSQSSRLYLQLSSPQWDTTVSTNSHWNFKCSRTLPTQNEQNSQRTRGSLPDGWCPHLWKVSSWARQKTRSSPETNEGAGTLTHNWRSMVGELILVTCDGICLLLIWIWYNNIADSIYTHTHNNIRM